jgi:hypothetical protein
MIPALEQLLAYRHPGSIKNYMRTYGVDNLIAEELFIDMLKYLWVSTKHRSEVEHNPQDPSLQFNFVMHQEMRDIDNMWHGFILYTQDYMAFCDKFFGVYLHHVPDVAEGITISDEEFATDMANYLSYIYDNLGEGTMRRWFSSVMENE